MRCDFRTAHQYAEVIRALYDGRIQPNVVCPQTDTQALVTQQGEVRVLVFPGTASTEDWITDVRIAKRRWSAGKVHAGFGAAYESVADKIRSLALAAQSIHVAGHSLGGALAALCAHDLAANGFPVSAVYTFGAPRVGNVTFARDYDAKLHDETFRIVNQRDPVPWLPPFLASTLSSPLTGFYKHAGTEVYLADDGTVQEDAPLWTGAVDAALRLTGKPAAPAAAQFISVSAHKIPAYLAKLAALNKA